jgi:hypothetical protein
MEAEAGAGVGAEVDNTQQVVEVAAVAVTVEAGEGLPLAEVVAD